MGLDRACVLLEFPLGTTGHCLYLAGLLAFKLQMANPKPERSVRMSDINTKTLRADAVGMEQATEILRKSGLLAFPTETVYGLGADATQDLAVARIYAAKGRPNFNPLIVHFLDATSAKAHVQWSEEADILADAFWPGAITLVLKKRKDSTLSPLLSAGLSSVAMRVPDHLIASDLLHEFSGPIAAPSANPSGAISPTTAEHVLSGLFGKIEGVIDAGACRLGLESTIIDLTTAPTLLRPGGIPVEAIEDCLGKKLQIAEAKDGIKAPGQLSSHYAPRARLRLNATTALDDEVLIGFGDMACDLNLSQNADLTEAAARLFAHLHFLDKKGVADIAVAPIPAYGLGHAINDRLMRAAAPRS